MSTSVQETPAINLSRGAIQHQAKRPSYFVAAGRTYTH